MTDSGDGPETVEAVTVVGGGDAGLLTSLLLEELTDDVAITIVDDFEEDIAAVGKSTIPYILETFHSVLGIDGTRFVSEVKPVWKASVYFRDWCGDGPFHVPFDDFTYLPGDPGQRRFEELYYRYRSQEYHTLGIELAERGLSPFIELLPNGQFRKYDHMAYHLGTDRLNGFLRELCRERGIELVDDRITDVRTGGNRIESVASDTAEYGADLYVDASGFKRLLMGELDNGFEEFDFPLDSAVVAKTDLSLDDIVPATVIDSGDHGWFWQIDTYDCRDLGYVYSSDHVSDDDAVAEFVAEKEGIEEADVRRYRFDSGVHQAAWVNNCVAVGNALGFVEPLQSTALTLNAILTEKLAEMLSDHDCLNHRGIRTIYNDYVRDMWDNVRDFITVHYQYASGDTEFWDAMRAIEGSETLPQYTGNYQENGFSSHDELDRQNPPTPRVFNQYIFYRVMHNLGVESAFYENVDVDVREEIPEHVEQQNEQIATDASHHLTYEEVYGMGVFD